jgi:hypothetical protein
MAENSEQAPCPGAGMGFTFYNLTPGREYTLTLEGGLSFTGASSKTGYIPGGVSYAGNRATFTAPAATLSFTLGVRVSSDTVSLSVNFTGEEVVIVSLLSGNASGQGALTFTVYESLPPTCVILYPDLPTCPVCAMDTSKCPEASAIAGSQFCMSQHIFLCCLECPGSQTDTAD